METDKAWNVWGNTEPYYGVLTDPKYLSRNLTPAAREDFFASGEAHAHQVLSCARRLNGAEFTPRRAMDFGSGVGRITFGLSKYCDWVDGVDIAPSMREIAQQNAEDFKIDNVAFVAAAHDLESRHYYDLIHSFLVFQHIRPNQGLTILSDLLARLSETGVVYLQLPYDAAGKPLRLAFNRLMHRVPGLTVGFAKLRRQDHIQAPMEMHCYPLNSVLRMLDEAGLRELSIETAVSAGIRFATIVGRRSA